MKRLIKFGCVVAFIIFIIIVLFFDDKSSITKKVENKVPVPIVSEEPYDVEYSEEPINTIEPIVSEELKSTEEVTLFTSEPTEESGYVLDSDKVKTIIIEYLKCSNREDFNKFYISNCKEISNIDFLYEHKLEYANIGYCAESLDTSGEFYDYFITFRAMYSDEVFKYGTMIVSFDYEYKIRDIQIIKFR